MKSKLFILAFASTLALVGCGGSSTPVDPDTKGVEGLKASGINEGIALTWKSSDNATSYLIYNGDNKVAETDNNFYTLSFLENNKNYRLGVAAKNSSGTSEITYVESTTDPSKDYDPFIDDLNTALEKRITASKIKNMFTAGNINNDSTNVSRFKSVLNKMKNGESQTIAYIGGSITVGEKAVALDDKNHQKGYAYHSYKWLKEHYDKNQNSKFINASISGTDSSIATVRLEKDVLVNKPNIVFVEFAGNNGGSIFDKKTYESLFRRLLMQEQKPAVILLFSAANYVQGQVNYMRPMGNYYKIPMFSFLDAMSQVCTSFDQNDPIFKFFTSDDVHPNDQGHKLYAKVLAYTLKALYNGSGDTSEYVLPTNPSQSRYDDYVNFKYINHESNTSVITSLGSFEAKDTSHRVLKDTADVVAFQKGWKKLTTTENEPMTIQVRCRNFFIIYMAGNSYVPGDPKGKMIASYQNIEVSTDKGSLTWESDRTCKQSSLTQVVDNGNGWDNPCCMILIDNAEAKTYNISIKMENASDLGTILALGYSD